MLLFLYLDVNEEFTTKTLKGSQKTLFEQLGEKEDEIAIYWDIFQCLIIFACNNKNEYEAMFAAIGYSQGRKTI